MMPSTVCFDHIPLNFHNANVSTTFAERSCRTTTKLFIYPKRRNPQKYYVIERSMSHNLEKENSIWFLKIHRIFMEFLQNCWDVFPHLIYILACAWNEKKKKQKLCDNRFFFFSKLIWITPWLLGNLTDFYPRHPIGLFSVGSMRCFLHLSLWEIDIFWMRNYFNNIVSFQ